MARAVGKRYTFSPARKLNCHPTWIYEVARPFTDIRAHYICHRVNTRRRRSKIARAVKFISFPRARVFFHRCLDIISRAVGDTTYVFITQGRPDRTELIIEKRPRANVIEKFRHEKRGHGVCVCSSRVPPKRGVGGNSISPG